MPIYNLGQISSMATTLAGGRMDWTPSETSLWANMAYSEIANKVGHTPLEALAVSSTTSGENRYTLPTDFDRTIALTMYVNSTSTSTALSDRTTSVVLIGKDANWIDSQQQGSGTQNANTVGQPEAYVQYATWFELWPSPTSAYSLQLRYFAKPPVLVDSTDTPALDERWQPALVFKTAQFLEASRNNVEGEIVARQRYLDYIASMPNDRSRKQQDRVAMTARFAWRKGPS